jgi:dihydroorotate dehydrogenase electron transfer subunit
MYKELCKIIDNKQVAPGHYVLKLKTSSIAKKAQPGQFVQILCSMDSMDPLLPRPFSFLDVEKDVISILYHVVGKGTGILSKLEKGKSLSVLGPLGNGFKVSPEPGARSPEKIILVGGGVGIPPLYHFAKDVLKKKSIKKENIHVLLGARTKSLLLCESEFKKLGVHLEVATNDGSKGLKGFVSVLLTRLLRAPGSELRAQVFTCGPTIMMKTVSQIASEFNVSCQVSVEVPMACGFGACLGCAIKLRAPGSELPAHRFAIACTEGPVFKGSEIVWE